MIWFLILAAILGSVPAMIALNKSDLVDAWLIPQAYLDQMDVSHN
jgi:hypothetical protein